MILTLMLLLFAFSRLKELIDGYAWALSLPELGGTLFAVLFAAAVIAAVAILVEAIGRCWNGED